MHFSDFTPSSAPSRLVRLAVCTLLPAFIQELAAQDRQRPASTAKSPPYLLVCLPPPLRFAEPVESADPVSTQPVALGPPHPGGLLEEIAALNQQAAMTATPPATTPSDHSSDTVLSPIADMPADASAVASVATPQASAPPASPRLGLSILPDDTPRAIRAEDVLVYFQFPAAAPASDQPPQSSATYRQQ